MPIRKLVSSQPRKPRVLDYSEFGLELTRLIEDPGVVSDLNYHVDSLRAAYPSFSAPDGGLCVACKGARMLCGKVRCPIVVRLASYFKVAPQIRGVDLEGASPPGVFIGRIGYPYVLAGPLTPPMHGDTSVLDLPELWFGKSIDEIAGFRSLLVRGKLRVHVKNVEAGGRLLDATRELALASNPVELELTFDKEPRHFMRLNDEVQPFGPSATVKAMKAGNTRWDQKIERAYGDDDLKAAEAVSNLYEDGVYVSRIQRAFSVGAFGLKGNRRFVPTRWSITAVDSIVSKTLMESVKTYPFINEYRVYESNYLDNRFEVLMIPAAWSYEAIEAWYPNTLWNPNTRNIVFFGDYEGLEGRTRYASMGGCYYAARLAVAEHLTAERRQASVLVLREAHPGYIMPVGVWQVRENVRNALRQPPLKFNTLEQALQRIASRFSIRLETWINESRMLSDTIRQKRLSDFPHILHL